MAGRSQAHAPSARASRRPQALFAQALAAPAPPSQYLTNDPATEHEDAGHENEPDDDRHLGGQIEGERTETDGAEVRELSLQGDDQDGADHRTERRAESAKQAHQDHVARL